jgi:hypothetical protein
MKFRTALLIALGIGLYFAGQEVGLQGDAAPLVRGGISVERATYHGIALVLTLGALGCFLAAGLGLFDNRRRD